MFIVSCIFAFLTRTQPVFGVEVPLPTVPEPRVTRTLPAVQPRIGYPPCFYPTAISPRAVKVGKKHQVESYSVHAPYPISPHSSLPMSE